MPSRPPNPCVDCSLEHRCEGRSCAHKNAVDAWLLEQTYVCPLYEKKLRCERGIYVNED